MGNLQVHFSHTVPEPVYTVPIMGTGTSQLVNCMGNLSKPAGISVISL
jgi:hypothetical protein